MFRQKILPAIGAIIAMFLVIGIFPRTWLDVFGASDSVKGIIVIAVAIGIAWLVDKFLRKKL